MDPNKTLKMIDDFLCARKSGDEVDQWCRDLIKWIAKGGFEPDWNKYKLGTSYYKCRVISERRRPDVHQR